MQPAVGLQVLRKAGGGDDVHGVIKARDEYWRRSQQTLSPTL